MTQSLAESLAGHSPDQWALDFLSAARFPTSPANVQAVVSWEYAESGAGGGMFNPLNTTQGGYEGETDLNSVGVKNFARYADGIAANAKVIHNGYYPRVVTAFELGTNARMICDLVTMSPWGTGEIALRGTVHPTPGPQPHQEAPQMLIVVLDQPGTPAGRDCLAVWDPAFPNRITLENGGRLVGDSKTPIASVRTWSPRKADGSTAIPAGVKGLGIAPKWRSGQMTAVTLACTGGLTYRAELPT